MVEAHQLVFLSSDRDGAPVAVSGIVLVPTGVPAPPSGRAVVAWAHGTTGLVDGCAPSLDAQNGERLNSTDTYDRIDQILAAGHIVVASDYPGLGTPGVHPYLDGVGEAHSVLDSIRAAKSFGANVAGHPELDRTQILTPSGEAHYDAFAALAFEANYPGKRRVPVSDNRALWILDRLAGRPLTNGVSFSGEAPRVLETCPGTSPNPATAPTTAAPVDEAPLSRPARPIVGHANFAG